MKTHTKITGILLFLLTLNSELSICRALTTAFTYQGRLNESNGPANGSYDIAFTLYATNTTGSAVAGPVLNTNVIVTNGLFTTAIDFGRRFSIPVMQGPRPGTVGQTRHSPDHLS